MLEQVDDNEVKLKRWLKKQYSEYGYCMLCNREVKYATSGVQAFIQHATKKIHKERSDAKFGDNQVHIAGNPSSSSSEVSKEKEIILDRSLADKVTGAEAMWVFKLAQQDYSLRSCENIPLLFKRMFPDSEVAKKFTMGRAKASYVVSDGLGPLIGKLVCLSTSKGAFTLLFDETTTTQNRKQMDVLIRYCCEDQKLVVTRYVMLFFCESSSCRYREYVCGTTRRRKRKEIPYLLGNAM